MGKAYANRKQEKERPESDFYPTPKSLTWNLLELHEFGRNDVIWEPACGNGAISNELPKFGYENYRATDLNMGVDFLKTNKEEVYVNHIITNPPFSLFDEFVLKAKELVTSKIAFIGKVNFFGATGRQKKGIWKNLSNVYIFDRQVDYRTPERDDGLFHVGNLVTGWFIWDMNWKEDWWKTSIISVQEYAKLGQVKE